MAKKDNIIDFRDYQPGKRETVETHSLDAFRETLYDLGFLGSSSDTLDETEEVEPETDDESEGESMVEETEPDDTPEVVESEDDDSESDDEEDDDEEIEEEPDKLKAPGESLNTPLSDLIIRETERGFRRFDSDETVVGEADFEEVDSEPEEESSKFDEKPPISSEKKCKHFSSSAGKFFKKLEKTSIADRILANFGFGEASAVQPSPTAEEKSEEDLSVKAENPQFNNKAQEILSQEIMNGKADRLKEWSKNDNVNRLMFLFSRNSILSSWIMENKPDIFWDLPDEVIDIILEQSQDGPEKKDDKDEKKS